MNIELGIDSNFNYENLTANETMMSSFETKAIKKNKENINQKSFINKLFFLWSRKAINIANKKDLKIKHLVNGQENLIYSQKNTAGNGYGCRSFHSGFSDAAFHAG